MTILSNENTYIKNKIPIVAKYSVSSFAMFGQIGLISDPHINF